MPRLTIYGQTDHVGLSSVVPWSRLAARFALRLTARYCAELREKLTTAPEMDLEAAAKATVKDR